MTAKITETIYIGKEAYIYLERIQRKQRGCKPLSEESEERMWNKLIKDKRGLRQVDDNSFGGGDGTYRGKWWSWSVDDLKEMLDEAGLPYEEGKPIEYYEVYL